MNDLPTIDDVRAAAHRISGIAHRTPVITSRSLNERFGAELYFKCENLQRAGAFKFRGACNAVNAAPLEALHAGVATHSSGNHAGALSLAAKLSGVTAHIVMPEDAPEVKKQAVAGYGAHIVYCPPTLASRESTLAEVVREHNAYVIHPYDNRHVIAGQGTAALEMLEDIPALDTLIAPVGGGGLLSGTAVTAAALAPAVTVIGAEPDEADDAMRSLRAGHIIPVEQTTTIADGLRTSLGERNFVLLSMHAVEIVTASEDAIVQAMRLIWERLKVVIEPSAAVALAILLEKRDRVPGQKIGVILSGGNVDLDRLPWNR
ncbi:MAG: threonine dehydratase [Gammaproteobacteria bacterium]|jgi:threonine dehydratase